MSGAALTGASAEGRLVEYIELMGEAVAGAAAEADLAGGLLFGGYYGGGGKRRDTQAESDFELEMRVRDYWEKRERREAEKKQMVDLILMIDSLDDAGLAA